MIVYFQNHRKYIYILGQNAGLCLLKYMLRIAQFLSDKKESKEWR
jgi:hypothetical protein